MSTPPRQLMNLATDEISGELNADVCIIGAGVAGQTVAMRLAKQGVDVLMVESGGRDFSADIQKLSAGENVGETYYDLDTTRLRLFGGTAAIWGGRCAELDAIDFTKRDYLPHSGWPISKDDLDPYYDRAYQSLGLTRPNSDRIWDDIGRPKPSFSADQLDVGLWAFDEYGERFTNPRRGNLGDVKTLLNATVTEIDVNDQGAVFSVLAKSLGGTQTRIRARQFVLAAGAVETVRLLLAAVPKRPGGLGNDKNLLGRFFMEHPHARGGEILPGRLADALMLLPRAVRAGGERYAAYIRPSDALQREKGILNTSLSFAPRRHAGENMDMFRSMKGKLKHDLPSTRFWRTLYKGLKGISIRARELTDPWPTVMSMKASGGKLGLYAVVRAEQAPIPSSRITLSDERDALGLPLACLDWQFSDIDKRSVSVLMETLKSEYQRLGLGDVTPSAWLEDPDVLWATDPLISAHPIGGYHHMGGTRMSDAPASGVVDKHCRLFESPNLHIASSSVFTTGGWANPTMTIMALAERLGDHLGKQGRA